MAYYKCGKIFATQNSNTSIETSSGAIANFNTSLAMPVLGCKVAFSASQASGTPTPATPIPIVGVDKVAIYNGGKNLIDLSSMVSGYVTTTGTFSLAHSMGEMRSDFIPVRPNTTYTFAIKETSSSYDSWCGIGLYKDNNISSFIVRRTNLWTFTTTEDTRFIVVSARNIADASQIQLEQGSDTTEYEAYNGTTALINLGDTYYGGEVDAVTGKITVKQKAFDLGDYTYAYNGVRKWFTVSNFAQDNNLPIPSSASEATEAISDIYVADNQNNISANADLTGVFGIFASGALVIKNTDYTNASDFQNAMRGKKIVCSITTPATAQASNTAEISTLNGLNQVYADTGDVEVKYRRLHNDL